MADYEYSAKIVEQIKSMLIDDFKRNDVPAAIQHLLEQYDPVAHHSLADLLWFHAKFEHIHPFQDGNGRVGG